MGYTTSFDGHFKFSRKLTDAEILYMHNIDNVGQPEVEYPNSYCQWEIDKYGYYLRWDNGEKFYYYVEWLEWLIENFFEPKEIELNGKMEWSGEEVKDNGVIVINDNKIQLFKNNYTNNNEKIDGLKEIFKSQLTWYKSNSELQSTKEIDSSYIYDSISESFSDLTRGDMMKIMEILSSKSLEF